MFSFFPLVLVLFALAIVFVAMLVIRSTLRKFEYRRQVRANMHLAVSRLVPAGRHALAA